MPSSPYEVIPPEKPPNTEVTKLWIILTVNRATYFSFLILGSLFYFRSDATSLGEIFAWAGLIAFSLDIFASLAAESLYGG
tara:strand:- start:1 stop:243 length:243 start_codon:yes stop_codon:yes gene_type:complete